MSVFTVAFHTGDRGADLRNMRRAELIKLPRNQGLVLNFRLTKTFRDDVTHTGFIEPNDVMLDKCAGILRGGC